MTLSLKHIDLWLVLVSFVTLNANLSHSFSIPSFDIDNKVFKAKGLQNLKSIPSRDTKNYEGLAFLLKFRNGSVRTNRCTALLYNARKDNEDDRHSWKNERQDKDVNQLKKALQNAKSNIDTCTSPGAGIEDPWEAAETAYADLIYTSTSFQNKTLSEEELLDLSKGGTMWEEGSTKQKEKGFLDGLTSLFGSLAGGAHIVRQEDGRI